MKRYSQLIRHSGNASLFDILDISVIGTLAEMPIHVHAEGLRGTGKTTIIRAYKEILPKINRIKGCLYNCNPLRPYCPEHRNLTAEAIEKIGTETIDMPFLEISPSAKKGTIVGSIDLKKISSKDCPEAALLLGTIPKAHRGIVFIDEINRIADSLPEITDLLLDVMGTKPGRIQIEEAGLPIVEMPVKVSIWSASNPDEDPGPLEDIRRQLSDRFDFTVNVNRPTNPRVVNMILDGLSLNKDDETEKIINFIETKNSLDRFNPSSKVKELFASLYVDYGIESLRGVEAALLGTKIRSALFKRDSNLDDVIFIAKHALRHRVELKNFNDMLKNLEQKKNLSESVPIKTSEKSESNATDLFKGSKVDKSLDKKSSKKGISPLRNIINKLISRQKPVKSNKENNQISNLAQHNINIKAPPQKALSLSELEKKEYVKTEKELLR